MKNSTLLRPTLILLALFVSPWATAKNFYIPAFCEPTQFRLQAQNASLQPQDFWIQKRLDGQVYERSFTLHPQESLELSGSQLMDEVPEALTLKTREGLEIKFKVSCQETSEPFLSDLVTPQVLHHLPVGAQTVKLSLLNLHLGSQKVHLRFLDSTGRVLGEEALLLEKYYDTSSAKYTVPAGARRLEVLGSDRLHSWAFSQSPWTEVFSPAISLGAVALQTPPQGVFFLVSTKSGAPSESFVVQITEPDLIQKAQEQLHATGFEKIVVARIQPGNGGFNRSFTRADKAPYSWSVSHVDALADFAYIDCDGSPDMVEENLQQRLDEGGRICFWRYRLVRELSAEEVRTGKLSPP